MKISVIITLKKDVLDPQGKVIHQTLDGMSKQEISKINKLAQKSFPKVTGNGVWGDPTKSSAKLGRKIISEVVNNLVKESNLTY